MASNFNANLAAPEGQVRDEEIAASMFMSGIEDMSGHFLPRRKPWLRNGRTWIMLRGGQEVRSCTNYLLGTYLRLLQNVTVWYARQNTDQYLVMGYLHRVMPDAHFLYLGKRTHFTIKPQNTPDGVDCLFTELWGGIPRPPWWERPHQAWISLEIWRLINARIAALRRKDGAHRGSRKLSRDIKARIHEYRRQRAVESGFAVGSLLTYNPPLTREACISMWG